MINAFSVPVENPDLNDGKKYERELIGLCGTKVKTDVYRVLDAFNGRVSSARHV